MAMATRWGQAGEPCLSCAEGWAHVKMGSTTGTVKAGGQAKPYVG